jgi:hypothetical protein
METALKGLEKSIATGQLKDRNKMERRLGKIQARHPQVNDLYDLSLRDSEKGVRLFWQMKEERKSWRECREGTYPLRTNLPAESAQATAQCARPCRRRAVGKSSMGSHREVSQSF